MSGESAAGSLAEQLAELGMQLDASTNLTRIGQEELSIETGSVADFNMISAFVKLLEDESRLSQGFSARIIEVPADANLETFESRWLDKDGVNQLMRDVNQTPGATGNGVRVQTLTNTTSTLAFPHVTEPAS